jgi:hypothetical protein
MLTVSTAPEILINENYRAVRIDVEGTMVCPVERLACICLSAEISVAAN